MMLMFTTKIKSMNQNLLACGEHFWVEITKCWVGQFYMRRVSTPHFVSPNINMLWSIIKQFFVPFSMGNVMRKGQVNMCHKCT
jgi:hypothetical protein